MRSKASGVAKLLLGKAVESEDYDDAATVGELMGLVTNAVSLPSFLPVHGVAQGHLLPRFLSRILVASPQ